VRARKTRKKDGEADEKVAKIARRDQQKTRLKNAKRKQERRGGAARKGRGEKAKEGREWGGRRRSYGEVTARPC